MQRIPNTLVIATRNKGKAAEFKAMLEPLGIKVRSLLDLDAEVPEVEEDGETFAENAEKKARAAAEALGQPALSDDSGLCVDALDGQPGVRSARYAGEPSSDENNNRKLLEELAVRGTKEVTEDGVTRLSPAQFVCALALYDPVSGETLHAEGASEGVIIDEARGANGFGYDPFFYVPALRKTFAELAPEEKNRLSHRGKALRSFIEKIERQNGGSN